MKKLLTIALLLLVVTVQAQKVLLFNEFVSSTKQGNSWVDDEAIQLTHMVTVFEDGTLTLSGETYNTSFTMISSFWDIKEDGTKYIQILAKSPNNDELTLAFIYSKESTAFLVEGTTYRSWFISMKE